MKTNWNYPTSLWVGENRVKDLTLACQNLKIKKPLFVTDKDLINLPIVINIISELDIPFIDLNKEVFEKEENPLKLFPFELFGHYNVEGYKKVAENIYKLTNE